MNKQGDHSEGAEKGRCPKQDEVARRVGKREARSLHVQEILHANVNSQRLFDFQELSIERALGTLCRMLVFLIVSLVIQQRSDRMYERGDTRHGWRVGAGCVTLYK